VDREGVSGGIAIAVCVFVLYEKPADDVARIDGLPANALGGSCVRGERRILRRRNELPEGRQGCRKSIAER
jgi:hypothetical protein